ncbi:MAG: MATE family efflux transporter, partial [Candidatus Flemingiibacterium sp.]
MNKDLTKGDPAKGLLLYTLPLLGSVLFTQLYNVADSLVAGNFINESSLAAVGNASEITLIY